MIPSVVLEDLKRIRDDADRIFYNFEYISLSDIKETVNEIKQIAGKYFMDIKN